MLHHAVCQRRTADTQRRARAALRSPSACRTVGDDGMSCVSAWGADDATAGVGSGTAEVEAADR